MSDAHKNFALSTVATAPSPSTTGTSLTVQSGDGTKFPTPPFNASVWPANTNPTTANAEIVRVTAISTDTFTIIRTQEGSSARSIGVGDQIAATITEGLLEWAERMPAKYAIFETDFLGAAVWGTNSGSGGAVSHQGGGNSFVQGHPGVMGLSSGTTSGGFAVVVNAGTTSSADFYMSDDVAMEFIFQTPSTITDTDIRFGIGVQSNGTPNWGYWIEKLAADTHFWFKVSNNGSADTRQDTGTTVAASTWYSVKLRKSGSVYYWSINRAAENAGYTGTNNPGGGQAAHVFAAIIVGGTTTSRNLYLDYMRAEMASLSR